MRVNVENLVLSVESKSLKFLHAVRSGWARASLDFIGHIQSTQMSGRPGLRVISNALRGGWHEDTKVINNSDVRTSIFTNVKYARVHEYGTPSAEIPAEKIKARSQTLHFITRRSKNGKRGGNRIAKPKAGRRSLVAHYKERILKIPIRLHVRDAWEEKGKPLLLKALVVASKQFGKA